MRPSWNRLTGRLAVVCTAAVAVLSVCTPMARGNAMQESIIQDDPILLGASQTKLDARFAQFAALGVDRVRVSLFWNHVAPSPNKQRKPRFASPGPSSPAGYPRGSWDTYDRIVITAARYGVGIMFNVTGPVPAWAAPGDHPPKRERAFRPDPEDFKDFVQAAGVRYSGGWPVDDVSLTPPPRRGINVGAIQIGAGQTAPPPVPRIPRVNFWSIWNEPNFPSWLFPVWVQNNPKTKAHMVPASPRHYRRLVDAAYQGLDASGHRDDNVVIGETAPRGNRTVAYPQDAMPPALFVREVYCLNDRYRPYRGKAARRRGCPATAAGRSAFRRQHSGLFRAVGWGHHPYSLDRRGFHLPTWRSKIRDNAPLAQLGRITAALDRAGFYWGSLRAMRIWITEYGYQTTPPDPNVGVRPRRQGPLMAWGEALAFRNPRVASVAQFLLRDDAPVEGYQGKDRRRWISWQSGLFYRDGRAKPSLSDYQRPIHVSGRAPYVRVFAGYRPAPFRARIRAQIQFRRGGAGWRPLRSLLVTNPRGYLDVRVTVPGRGRVRVMWQDPVTGVRTASRQATAG